MANFRQFENQLKNYLIRNIKNENEAPALMRKYGNIRFSFDHNKFDRSHFIIRVGISEAAFDIDTGMLLSGGLGPESNQIKNWINKFLKKAEIKSMWQTEHKNFIKQKEELAKQEEELKKKKEENS